MPDLPEQNPAEATDDVKHNAIEESELSVEELEDVSGGCCCDAKCGSSSNSGCVSSA